MKIDYSVGLYPTRIQPPVPTAVERGIPKVFDPFWRQFALA